MRVNQEVTQCNHARRECNQSLLAEYFPIRTQEPFGSEIGIVRVGDRSDFPLRLDPYARCESRQTPATGV